MKTNDVLGLGNALMDFLIEVNEETLASFQLRKGEFNLVDEQRAAEIMDLIQRQGLSIETVPGGSAANTVKAIAHLGGGAILCGKVGEDQQGKQYIQEMEHLNVSCCIGKNPTATGHAITFITPDAQRTFSVHLGAAVTLVKEDVDENIIEKSKILHLEAYQLEGATRETVLHAIQLAKKHGTLVSLDLADAGVIRRNKGLFHQMVRNDIDILFLNEQEAEEFTGMKEVEKALAELSWRAPPAILIILKLGERGSLIYTGGKTYQIPAFPATAIDTTGAGDTYAAGFLYGYCRGWPLEKAGRLGSALAAKIVEMKGVKVQLVDSQEIKNLTTASCGVF